MQVQTRLLAIGAAWALALLGTVQAARSAPVDRTSSLAQLSERFRAEIYPLLARSDDGCKLCHSAQASQTFQVLESPSATFSLLLEQGLLDPSDPMAIPSRVRSQDSDLRMPKSGVLDDSEITNIARFATDLAATLGSEGHGAGDQRDERFPDSLLLPFDGEEQSDRAHRRLSYFQLRRSIETVFGSEWLAASGDDLFSNKAQALGGADFRSSFDQTRTMTASYVAALQEIARELARRFVSAPSETLFKGFNPDIFVDRSRGAAVRNVRTLYQRILFAQPSAAELDRALHLVRELQARAEERRIVRFTLNVEDPDGRRDRRQVDVTLDAAKASVSRYLIDQTSESESSPWVRIGDRPFRFEAANPDHLVRLVARPGNHVTVFDAVKFVRVRDGIESSQSVVLDNLDPECTFSGEWEPVAKDGERSRAGEPKKKYEIDLDVVGINHLERRDVDNRLGSATVALRIPEDGEYNVYLSWPRIPRAATSALLEVHSASVAAVSSIDDRRLTPGFATTFLDQSESTLDDNSETQWEMILREVLLEGPDDFVEVSNRGVDSASRVIVTDAVKFVPLGGGQEIVVDNSSADGFEASDGWATDKLVRNLPGRGEMYGENVLHYPPAESGEPIKDQKVDPAKRIWARYRPVQGGAYRPGWYSVHVWTPGGHTHADWVPFDVHGSSFAPVAFVEAPPAFNVGETAFLNATGTYHPGGDQLSFRWTHDASDLGLRVEGAETSTPSFAVPSLNSPRPGWAGLIEALLQRPEFVMPTDSQNAAAASKLVRVALDLVGRVPTTDELQRFLRVGQIEPLIDAYLSSNDFREFFFHRARGIFRSRGTPVSDEPARLWTYIATNDLSYRELFTADYTVGSNWQRIERRPAYGPTGFLTMKGYMEGKPGLPKFTYPAQVLTFALGVQFEVSDAVEDARDQVVSTTDPSSICYSCHKLLTPLAYQRERWDVHGHYRTVDDDHQPIDDSDRGIVPDYPFKGDGLSAFASQVVRKERFVRAFINHHHDMLFHRPLRLYQDQRDEYKDLYDFAVANDLRIRPLVKKMVVMRFGGQPHGQ